MGNSFLDNMQAESACVGPFEFSSCGTDRSWMLPLLYGVFNLFCNILMVNLLIAIFNATVSHVNGVAYNVSKIFNVVQRSSQRRQALLAFPEIRWAKQNI